MCGQCHSVSGFRRDDDPYAAIRTVAHRSLRSLEGFEDFEYDWSADGAELSDASRRALAVWKNRRRHPSHGTRLLISESGAPLTSLMRRLESQRDDRPILIAE